MLREPVPLTPSPARALESPVPLQAEPSGPWEPGGLTLDDFLDLSELLTGFENLSPQVGQQLLTVYQRDAGDAATLVELYEAAGIQSETPPERLDEVEELLAEPQRRDLVDRIIEAWYTGRYNTGEDETEFVTFVDALAWKSVGYTSAQSLCGPHMGFWANRPHPPVESSS